MASLAKFSMYHPSEMQVYFIVEEDAAEGLQASVDQMFSQLQGAGYTVQHPALAPGQRIEEIQSWVKGQTKKRDNGKGGDACVHLYGIHPGLQFKVITVWSEDIDKLPFAADVHAADAVKGGAPERDQADLEGDLHKLPGRLQVALDPTDRLSDKGNVIYRFSHVIGHTSAPPAASPTATQETPPTPFRNSSQAAQWAAEAGVYGSVEIAEDAINHIWKNRPSSLQITPVSADVQSKFMQHLYEQWQPAA